MKPLVRYGRRVKIPSSLQIKHELRLFIADANVRELCAEAEGLSAWTPWSEICTHRAQAGLASATAV